jgi:hypothetical protein
MAHFHFDDDEYWQNCPPELEAYGAARGGQRRAGRRGGLGSGPIPG